MGFVVSCYVFCYQKVTIVAIRLKLGVGVYSSFFSMCGSLEVVSQSDCEVMDANVTGGESRLVANAFKPGTEYLAELRKSTWQSVHKMVQFSPQLVWELNSHA